MDEELERFKRNIRLHEYAASLGYEMDKRESSRREIVMRKSGDKIAVRLDVDGHHVYYSFRDEKDNGTILDFVMTRQGKNFGEARKALRLWRGTASLPVFEPLEPQARFDRAAVMTEYQSMKALRWHDWLEKERCLPRTLLHSRRFRDCLRVDARANVIFPHEDEFGVCGFERRNRNFKGFASLGKKGLWSSAKFEGDRCLVVGESAIDCISYQAIFPEAVHRYVSLAGGLNPEQPALILKACRAMPAGSEVISITHPDPDGERYSAVIAEMAAAASVPFRVHRPEGVKDWNDALQARAANGSHSFPAGLGML